MAIQTKVVDDGGSKKKQTAQVDNGHGGSSGSFVDNTGAKVAETVANGLTGNQNTGTANKSGNSGSVKTPTTQTAPSGNVGGGGGGSGSGSSASGAASTPNYDTTVPSVFGDTTDPELLAQYQSARSALEAMKGQAPVYGNQYDEQIQSLYQQIIGRDPFKYDPETDPLYKQYEQSYIQRGKMASRDVMGQAAGLTGGYGSSYGQAVGQQMYDQYLQNLADILPQTYGMALDAYNAEGDRLNQNLSTTVGLEQTDYQKYLDSLNQYNTDLDRAYQQEDLAYGRLTDKEKQNYNRQLDQYDMQNDYYNRLLGLMSVGYVPSVADYNKAGLSQAQGEAIRAQYAPAPASSGGGRSTSTANTQAADSAFEQALLSALGGGSSGMNKSTGGTKTTNNKTAQAQATAKVASAVNKLKNALK